MADAEETIAGVYRRSHDSFAERSAVRDDQRELTYAELGREARKLANALRRSGIAPGSRIVMLAPNSCDWVVADHALALGGYPRVGVLPRLHAAEIERIALDIEPSAIIVDSDWLDENGAGWIPESVELVLVIGASGTPPDGQVSFSEFVAGGEDEGLEPPGADEVAWVLYTSGSTGQPKGVLASQRSVAAMVRNCVSAVEFRADDVSLHTAPISHFSGTVVLDMVAVGGLSILKPSFEIDEVVRLAEGGEVTVLPLVPTMITMLVEELSRRGVQGGRVGAVRMLPYAGSAIQPDRAARAGEIFGQVLTQFYGSSESPIPVSVLLPRDHVDREHVPGLSRLASAGRLGPGVEVEILDVDGTVLPVGAQGEIKVRSQQSASGYWDQPVETAQVFDDGWVLTGDVGCIDDEGFLYILDRRKDMIVSGGFNIYPREVENAISTLAGVREVAVVGAPHERWGESVVAVVALEPGAHVSPDAVIAHCRTTIGGYKVPKRVEIVDSLPKGGSGKILKATLRDGLWAGRSRRV